MLNSTVCIMVVFCLSIILCSKVYCHLAAMLCNGIIEQFLMFFKEFTENIVNIGSHQYPLTYVL